MPQPADSPDALYARERAAFGEILSSQIGRYLHMQLPDLYKWLHQACMGSEHAVVDEEAARGRLDRELGALGEGPAEPLVDVISGDGRIGRIHLRPYIAGGRAPNLLLEGFLRTAREFRGSPAHLRRVGRWAVEMAAAGGLPFSAQEVAAYLDERARAGFPAVHHSRAYAARYHPAYRVVAKECLPAPLRELWERECARLSTESPACPDEFGVRRSTP